MSKDNMDEEVNTDSEDIEETTSSEDNSKQSSGSDTDQEKGKKFDVWKEYKRLKKENKLLIAMDANNNEDDSEIEAEIKKETKGNFDVEYEIFMLKNPEAVEYTSEIKDTLKEFPGISLEKALSFSKVNYAKSTSTKDFSTKSANLKKELGDYSKEEILATKDKKKLLEWSRIQKRIS